MNKTADKLLGRYFHSPNTNTNSNLNLSPYNCRRNHKFNTLNDNYIRIKNTPLI